MNVAMRVEIHFHGQYEASAFLESSSASEDERFGEVLLSVLFTARNLANFGRGDDAGVLLANTVLAVAQGLPESAHVIGEDGVRLVPFQGAKGRKGFVATLELSDQRYNFQLKPWGLGLMGRGAGFYAPHATLTLIRHLVRKREMDGPFAMALGLGSEMIAQAFLSGKLTRLNQGQLALAAALAGCSELGVGGWRSERASTRWRLHPSPSSLIWWVHECFL